MRIQRLSLERFGHFTDREFDFGSGDDGDFHIIYGPNEAGKTTTMEAALRLFYGFPNRSRDRNDYAFKHPRKNLQVSATLDLDGAVRRFTRLPKQQGSLVDEVGVALPEAALSAHLAGLLEPDYRRLLCLDDETIERGGEEIANAQGDIGRLLFSAAAGVADLSTVLDGVRGQADEIWKKGGRKTRMAELKRTLSDLDRQIKDRDVTASAWKVLKKDLTRAQETEQEARKARDDLNTLKARIDGQRRALPLIGEIAALEAAIAPFSDHPDQLDFDPERLIELRSAHGIASQNIERLAGEIAELTKQRTSVSVDPALSELGAVLTDLEDLFSRDRTAHLDLARRQSEERDAKAAMTQAQRDLGVVSADVDPQTLVLSAADIATLEAARQALRDAIAQEASEARELNDLREKVSTSEQAVQEGATEGQGAPRISDVLLRFDADQLAPKYAAACQAIEAATLKANRSLGALTVGAVAFEALPNCPSSLIQATTWAERHDALCNDLRTSKAKRDDHRADCAARRAQADALIRGANIVSDTAAADLFRQREALWSEHLAAMTPQTAAVFHDAQRAHDTATEARFGQARELGQLRQIEQAEAEATARAAQADKGITALTRERDNIEQAVRDATAQVGFSAGMPPAEWLAWVIRHEAAEGEAQTLGEIQEANGTVLQRAEALHAALSELLPFSPVDLETALTAARRGAEQERAQAEKLSNAAEALRQARRDFSRREERWKRAEQNVGAARETWQALTSAHLSGAVSPDNLMASLEPLRELREHEKTRAAAAQRVSAMQADQARFSKEVEALAHTHGVEAKPTAAETYAELKEMAAQAQVARHAVETLEQDIEAAAHEKDQNEEKLRGVAQEVEAIAAVFPDSKSLTDIDRLRHVAAQAQQAIEGRATLSKLRRTILSELNVDDIAVAREQLADVSAAGLDAAIESNRSDLDHAEETLTQAIRDRTTAEHALSQVKGDGEIAALVEQKATVELELEQAAMDHLELSLGHYLASDAIRRYRDSHRSGMMTATEQCFASLTQGAYPSLITQIDKDAEVLLAVDRNGTSKRAAEMSKGTRFQLYLALRAAAHEQLVAQGTKLPFFCDDIFETFDEDRTSAACRVMETIGNRGQAIYLTHHRHVVDIAMSVCDRKPILHQI